MDRQHDAIAIVGIGCRAPGASNIKEFWRVLERGENHVLDIPPERWNARAYYDLDPMAPGRSYVMKAGLVKNPEDFDNRLYGINDLEAMQVDPQQRFVLDCVTMAMEDAGITRAMLKGSKTGVYIGVTNSDYRSLFPSQSSDISNYTVTGISNSIIAARVSYVWDLRGPSLVLDTACSSSLIAMHLGIQAIRAGDCDMAICGGTNYLTLPDIFVFLSKARMISPGGQCRPFSADADGYARGEGCGVVILKRLCDAERDRDHIWATISTASNQDGHTVTPLIAPSGQQQQQLLRDMYSSLGDDVDRIDYIEAHGTGTPAGDPVEAEALGTVFKVCGAQVRERFVGSVKSNIGHLEPAAGVMGVIKVLLMMKHGKIVPSLFFAQPNPRIDFSALHLKVPTRVHEWKGRQKVAVCNSFGFGGSNCHAVLTEHSPPRAAPSPAVRQKKHCVVCFTANSEKSLLASVRDFLEDEDAHLMNVGDISYTSTVRRHHFAFRLSKVVDDVQELLSALEDSSRVKAAVTHAMRRPSVVFVFCGMGTSWPAMCLDLARHLQVFRDTLLAIDKLLSEHVAWSLMSRLADESAVKDAEFSPIAIFACQVALTALWRSVGVEVDCVVGQSVGEVAAAHAAGCLDLQQAVKVVYHRTHLLARATGGSMLVVRNCDVDNVKKIIQEAGGDVSVSLQYSPRACALSGDDESLSKVRHLLTTEATSEAGVVVTNLDVPVAYHSPHVDSCKQPLAQLLHDLSSASPRIPFVSSVTGSKVDTELSADYWVRNLREPVLFYQAVKTAHSSSKQANPIFLEIGPKPVLRAHLQDIFPDGKAKCLSSMHKEPELKIFLEAVSALYDQGVDILWDRLPTAGSQVTSVPRYAFDTRPLLPRGEGAALLLNGVVMQRQQHAWVWQVNEPGRYLLMISARQPRSVYDHVMSGRVIVPGSLYGEVGFAIAAAELKTKAVAVSLDFVEPLPVERNKVEEIEIRTVRSRTASHQKQKYGEGVADSDCTSTAVLATVLKGTHTTATITVKPLPGNSHHSRNRWVNLPYLRSKCPDQVPKHKLYDSLSRSGFQYGENFKLLEDICKGPRDCLAKIRTTQTVQEECEFCTMHFCVLDCMLHSTVLIQDEGSEIRPVMPKSLARLVVHGKMEAVMMSHAVKTYQDSEVSRYDITLMSESGLVIAEVTGLVVLFLDRQTSSATRDLYASEWHLTEEELPRFDVTSKDGEEGSVLFITTDDNVNEFSGGIGGRAPALPHRGLTAECVNQLEHKTFSAVAVVCAGSLSEQNEANQVQESILSSCLLIKNLLSQAVDLSLAVPIFVCTQKAWPSPGVSGKYGNDLGSQAVESVNPVQTAVWGLVRAALRENVYPSLVALDLHSVMPGGQIDLSHLAGIITYLCTDSKSLGYPEILVSSQRVFVNRVVEVSSRVTVPAYRVLRADPTDTPVFLSDHPTCARNQIAVVHEAARQPKDQTTEEITAEAFALPGNSLRGLSLNHDDFQQTYGLDIETDRYPIVAVETVGTVLGDRDRKVCCSPVVAAARVTVPGDLLVSASVIPAYQPGDLARLLLLWMLQSKAKTSHVTILTSSPTHEVGKLMSSLLQARKINKKLIVANLVSIDSLDDQAETIHETVISLVLLDAKLARSLAPKLVDVRCLVAFSVLVDNDTATKLAVLLPKMAVKLLTINCLLQSRMVAKYLPHLVAWLKSNQSLAKAAMEMVHDCIHEGTNEGAQAETDLFSVQSLLRTETMRPTWPLVWAGARHLFRRNAVYLVVGGLTGLGWLWVEYLARRGAGGVATVNRRQPSSDQVENIRALSSATSCDVHAFQADVTSLQSLCKLIDDVGEVFQGRAVRGVVYGAAVVEDRPLFNLGREEFDKVLAPKVQGAWNMHCVTRNMPLDFFVMLSSIASVFGNIAQSNYAAGNAFLDGLVYYRRSQGLEAQCINWGPLDLGILEGNTKVKQRLEAHGLSPLTREAIVEKLTPLLMLNWEQITPVALDKVKMQNVHAGRQQVGFLRRMELIIKPRALAAEAGGTRDYREQLSIARTLPHDQRLGILEKYMSGMASQLLCLDPSAVTPDSSLYDLGLDSVVAMSMISAILTDTNVRLPVVLFVSGQPTVAIIACALSEGFDGKKWDEVPAADSSSGPVIEEIFDPPDSKGEESESTIHSSPPATSPSDPICQPHPNIAPSDALVIKEKVVEIRETIIDKEKQSEFSQPGMEWLSTPSLTSYPQTSHKPLLGIVDIPLAPNASSPGRIKAVIASLVDRHAPLRKYFESTGPSGEKAGGRVSSIQSKICLCEIDDGPEMAPKLEKETMRGSQPFGIREFPLTFILVHSAKPVLRVVFRKAALDVRSGITLSQHLEAALASRPVINPSHDAIESSAPCLDNSLTVKNVDESVAFWRKVLDRYAPSASATASLSAVRKKRNGNFQTGFWHVGSETVTMTPELFSNVKAFLMLHDVSLLSLVASCYQLLLHAISGCPTIALTFPIDLRPFAGRKAASLGSFSQDIPLLFRVPQSAGKNRKGRSPQALTAGDFVVACNRVINIFVDHSFVPFSQLPEVGERLQDLVTGSPHGVTAERLQGGHLAPPVSNASLLHAADAETLLCVWHDLLQQCVHVRLNFAGRVISVKAARGLLGLLMEMVHHVTKEPGLNLSRMIGRSRRKGRKLLNSRD